MSIVSELKSKLLNGEKITRGEAISLINAPLGELCAAADEIRERFCGNIFDMCTIINGKSGRCSENCKYCAQSAHYNTLCEEYPLLSAEKLVEGDLYNYKRGVLRYSIVCSGKRLSDSEVDSLCESVRAIKKACPIRVCVSAGLLDEASFRKLKEAGVDRVHNNLESSRGFFPEVCTTHTFDDKIAAINAAKAAGLEVCSGGIYNDERTSQGAICSTFSKDFCLSILYRKGSEIMEIGIFDTYPDVLDVVIISEMLHISKTKVYELIHDKKIKGFLIGRKFRVLKKEVIRFINTVPII